MAGRSTEPYMSAYLHSRGGRLGMPVSGNFELTARCNFRCPMCYVHLSQEDAAAAGRELTAQQWIQLAREARDQGLVFALLTGGEPFLRKDFFEIYHAMQDLGLIISINSNGSLLSGEIRRKLLERPPSRINISLYGGCADTYRRMCGQDAFSPVVENIRALREAGVDVRLNLSITPDNRADMEKIYDISRQLDVHVKASSYMYPPIRVNGQQFGCGSRLSPEEAGRCAVQWDLLRFTGEEFDARANSMRQLTSLGDRECTADLDEGVSCRAGYSSFWMTWDGRMLPCGMMPGPEARPLEVGFQEAWRQIREKTAGIRMPVQCAECPKREVCHVCAAVCVTETGSFDRAPDYVCRMTEQMVRSTLEKWKERGGNWDAD